MVTSILLAVLAATNPRCVDGHDRCCISEPVFYTGAIPEILLLAFEKETFYLGWDYSIESLTVSEEVLQSCDPEDVPASLPHVSCGTWNYPWGTYVECCLHTTGGPNDPPSAVKTTCLSAAIIFD